MAMGVAEEGAVEVVDMGAVAMEVVAAEVAAAAMVRIIQIIYDMCLALVMIESTNYMVFLMQSTFYISKLME